MANLAKQNQITRSVEVNRVKLLDTLNKNREKHINEYKAAMAGYKTAVLKQLEEKVEKARQKLEERYLKTKHDLENFDPNNTDDFSDYIKVVESITIDLPLPINYSDCYDTAIDMIHWDVNPTITLSGSEFKCFVRNEWDWTVNFETLSKRYLVS